MAGCVGLWEMTPLGPEAAPRPHPHPHRHCRLSPSRTAYPTRPGADPTEATARALLTLTEVREDVVLPELGSSSTHLGVAIAEAAAAAGWVVGLQVKRPWATSEKEAGHAHRPNEQGAQPD